MGFMILTMALNNMPQLTIYTLQNIDWNVKFDIPVANTHSHEQAHVSFHLQHINLEKEMFGMVAESYDTMYF